MTSETHVHRRTGARGRNALRPLKPARSLRQRALDTYNRIKEDAMESRAWVPWAGVAAGVIAVAGAALLIRSRARRAGAVEQKLHDGIRLAFMLPAGFRKLRKSAAGMAEDTVDHLARETTKLWAKVPHVKVELK